jgi:hypothetical protein
VEVFFCFKFKILGTPEVREMIDAGRTAEEKFIQKFIAFVRAGIYLNTAAVTSKALPLFSAGIGRSHT